MKTDSFCFDLRSLRLLGLSLLAFALIFSLAAPLRAAGDAGASGGKSGAADKTANSLKALEKEHKGDKPTATPVAMTEPAVPVVGEVVTYATIDGQDITGYMAQPETPDTETLPAIIVIHEWWGLNENIEAMARRFAGEGYRVLAVDLYGSEVATNPAAARNLMRSVMNDPGPAQNNLMQASQFLTDEYSAPKIGVVGWCFGGNWSLRSGLLLQDLDAIAIYYGQLILQPEALDGLQAPVIGFFGENDSSIAVKDVENFETILSDLGKPADINLYPGVGHAFANPSGRNYDAPAAEDAWEKTIAFFAENLN